MTFIQKENLYNSCQFVLNGIKCFKYVDLLLYEDNKLYHIVLIKKANFFTLMMGDLETFPDYNLTAKALIMLTKVDFSSFSSVEKPKNEIFNELLNLLHKDKFYYRYKNYILNINKNIIFPKLYKFQFNSNIKIETANVSITNLESDFIITINNSDLNKIDGYQRLFNLSVDDEIEFNELLCLDSMSSNNKTKLHLVSENSYYLKNTTMEKINIKGNHSWTLEVMTYLTNIGRDVPIEINVGVTQDTYKRYFFVFPIKGITLKTDIRFGMITLSPDSGISDICEDKLKEVLNNDIDCFAQIVIVHKSPKEAIYDALKLLKKTINILKMLLLDDSPFLLFNNKNIPNIWDINFVERTIEIGSHFYIEDVLKEDTNAILSYKHHRKTNKLVPNEMLIEEINKNNFLEEYFYSADSKEKESILQAIFWLNESFEKIDKKERIISLYNSIEFLVKNERGVTLEEELSETYDEYIEIKESLLKVLSCIKNNKLKDRMSGILLKCFEGDTSVKTKFNNLTNRLKIILSDKEWEIYDNLKNNRHALIHNKKCKKEISNKELDTLYHVISKVIINKIIFDIGTK